MVKTAQCSSVSGAYALWACTSIGMHLIGGLRRKSVLMDWVIGVSDIQIASISVSNAVIS